MHGRCDDLRRQEMLQGEVPDWMTPATASPSASRRVWLKPSDWTGPRWTTDSMWRSRPVRAVSMVTANGSVPRVPSTPPATAGSARP